MCFAGGILIKKTWKQKLEEVNESHGKIVRILIPKPKDVETLIKKIPNGKLITDAQIRNIVAKENNADAACSKVTGIFLRIIAEAAEEDRKNGNKNITPYWRVIDKDGQLKPKFPGGFDGHAKLLKEEGHVILSGKGKKPPIVKNFEKSLVDF